LAYQSLYRKYRPQRFGELIGQEHLTSALLNSVREGRVGHAYLFSGPRGTGKTTTARILAKALNCLRRGDDGEPCGECENCVSIAGGTFADLVELDAASNTGVDAIRDLIERVHLGVGASTVKKAYIVDEVHMLSTAAANALLKTLEEPPDHVVFVLATTNPEKVLPTIRSRTQHFELSLYTTAQLVTILREVVQREGVDADEEALERVAHQGSGSARDAISLLDQALAAHPERLDLAHVADTFGGAPFDLRLEVLEAVAVEDPGGALGALSVLLETGHEPRRVADDLLHTLRDAFVLTAAGPRVRVDATEEEQARLRGVATQFGNALLVRALETLGRSVADMRGTDATDPRLTLEIALVRIARRDTLPQVQSLVDRIERIEQTLADGDPPAGPGPAAATDDADTTARQAPSLGALRRQAPPAAPAGPPGEPPGRPPAAESPPPPPPAFDLDDVIVAWAAVLPQLALSTRNVVQEAQPIAIEDDVVVFGVAPRAMERAKPRFQKEAPQIRAALSEHLGANPRFRLVPHDALTASSLPPAPAAPATPDEPVVDATEDVPDPAELVDAPPSGAAVDSVSRLQSDFGATVVEEIPRT
jgi:DNA polymerase-3 subunit gamma/tau